MFHFQESHFNQNKHTQWANWSYALRYQLFFFLEIKKHGSQVLISGLQPIQWVTGTKSYLSSYSPLESSDEHKKNTHTNI